MTNDPQIISSVYCMYIWDLQSLMNILHVISQTPRLDHCPQIRFGRESDQNLKCTETATKMRNLFCNDLEYIGLFQVIIRVIICHIQLNNCVFLQQSSAADVRWQYFSLVFGIPQSSHVSWQWQFKLNLILLGTMSCSQLTSIEQWHGSLFPRCILLQHLMFPIIGYKPCLHDTGHPAAGYVCKLKIEK